MPPRRFVSAAAFGLLVALISSASLAAAAAATAADTRSYTPGDSQDPQLRVAQFQTRNGQYLDALTLLPGLRQSANGKSDSADARLLAQASTGFGLPAQAQQLFRESASASEENDSIQGRLDLADQLYQHGQTNQAVSLLHALPDDLSSDQSAQRNNLLGRALLRLGEDSKAITALQKAKEHGPKALFARYNLGVALLRTGDTKNGLKQLDIVGIAKTDNSDQQALRDRANVVLGYYFLKHRKPPQAMDAFTRVQSHGPYSNRALLGLGWAYLAANQTALESQITNYRKSSVARLHRPAPDIGTLINPGFLDWAYEQRKRIQMVERIQKVKKSHRSDLALNRALVPWSRLLDRDPMDPAVQEGMMAVPYALEKSGLPQKALAYYKKAIKALEQTRSRIAQARKNIKTNQMIDTMIASDPMVQSGWDWRLLNLPDAVETFYLQRIIAAHPFQTSLKNYRDLRLLQQVLGDSHSKLGALLRHGPGSRGTAPLQATIDSTRAKPGTPPASIPSPSIALSLSTRLGTVGPGQDRAVNIPNAQDNTAGQAGHAGLTLDQAPPQGFGGAPLAIEATRARIIALQTRIGTAVEASSKRLQSIALSALDTQDATAKKYLIQVRLAVAQIYDHQNTNQHGSMEPSP